MHIYSVSDPEFKSYGRVWDDVPSNLTAPLVEALAATPIPEGTKYVASAPELEDGKLDTACVKAFRVPAGKVVEVFNTTLHYTPCMVDDGGFQVMVALPAGTNGPRPEAAADMPAAGDSYCYWKADKWVLCHADSPKAAEGGYVGLVGKNLDIACD